MKLTITKKNIKNLSQDNNRLPANMTKLINGGSIQGTQRVARTRL
ncbi:hypothetical protein [Pseudoalteromonas luteoviolacea]|nr:hypothetical protein [Pseudoalteromonas luteoviolacea]